MEANLIGHDDEREVWRVAVVVDERIADVETVLRVPHADFDQVFPFELEQIQGDVGATTFFEAHLSRQSLEIHLSCKGQRSKVKGQRSLVAGSSLECHWCSID